MIDEKELKAALKNAAVALAKATGILVANGSAVPGREEVFAHLDILSASLNRASAAVVLPLQFKGKKKEEEA